MHCVAQTPALCSFADETFPVPLVDASKYDTHVAFREKF